MDRAPCELQRSRPAAMIGLTTVAIGCSGIIAWMCLRRGMKNADGLVAVITSIGKRVRLLSEQPHPAEPSISSGALSRLSQYAGNPNSFPPATSQQFEETKPISSLETPRCFLGTACLSPALSASWWSTLGSLLPRLLPSSSSPVRCTSTPSSSLSPSRYAPWGFRFCFSGTAGVGVGWAGGPGYVGEHGSPKLWAAVVSF